MRFDRLSLLFVDGFNFGKVKHEISTNPSFEFDTFFVICGKCVDSTCWRGIFLLVEFFRVRTGRNLFTALDAILAHMRHDIFKLVNLNSVLAWRKMGSTCFPACIAEECGNLFFGNMCFNLSSIIDASLKIFIIFFAVGRG